MTFWNVIFILTPFFFSFFLAGWQISKSLGSRYELSTVLSNNSKSAEDKKLLRALQERKDQEKKMGFVQRANAKLNLYGVKYKFETLFTILLAAGIVFAIFVHIIMKAGPLLTIYIALVILFMGYQYMQNNLAQRKENLTLEFLEKLRDMTSYLSAGKSVPVALTECLETGIISPVLYRELTLVRGDISLAKPMSESFMAMYYRMDIPEVKVFAQTLAVYEEQGGNLISIMQASDRFFSEKLTVKNQQKVITTEMRSTQKFIVGIPLGFVLILAIINPSLYGNFYETILGQFVGIGCITMLLIGIFLSRKISTI